MKKMLSFLLAMLMMLGVAPAMAAGGGEGASMPDEIADLFDVPAWEGYEVMQGTGGLAWIYDEELEAGIVVMTNGSLEVVCLIEPDKDDNLRITQRNYTMVTSECELMLEVGYGTTSVENNAPWGLKRMFELYHVNDQYYICIGKFDDVWRVKVVQNEELEVLAFVNNEKIGYSEKVDHGEYITYGEDVKYAYGTYDNRFSAFNIYDFPKTLEEARAKLTNPPVTPSDFYIPVNVELRAGEKYDVFAAPGRDSYRAANGKAEMSTNDWVQIFGEEDGWLLVQYDISRDQMRFGYIAASALPRNTEVQRLRWYDLPEQTIKTNTYVTDDPLASCSAICWLNAGDKVKVLSDFGSWYYVEVTPGTGKTLRGFIPQTAIDLITWDDMKG